MNEIAPHDETKTRRDGMNEGSRNEEGTFNEIITNLETPFIQRQCLLSLFYLRRKPAGQ